MMRFGLDPHLIDLILGVAAKYSAVTRIAIFGSRARGDYGNASDIDIALFGSSLGDLELAQLKLELDALPIIFTLDVVHVDRLEHGRLRDKILGECVDLKV